MKNRSLNFCLTSLPTIAMLAGSAVAAEQPNIVFILTDDLGYGSVGCYGADKSLVRTPNIDRLAAEGIRFTDAQVPATVCSASRYSLLTGRHCWRTPENHGVLGVYAPLLIETNRMNMASLLKQQGYATAAIGKWHQGYGLPPRTDFREPLVPGPLQVGFDYHFGVAANHGDETGVYIENEGVWGLRSKTLTPRPGCFYRPYTYLGLDAPQRKDDEAMDFLTGKAISWMEQQPKGKPFFLYFPMLAVHEPITPSKESSGTSAAGPYGDFIHDIDLSVGRILKALEKLGVLDNTLVIFTSDNGGSYPDYGPNKVIQQAADAGLKINGPLRWRKLSIFEGGSRVPFVARWPGRIPAGKVSDETINLIDMTATFAELTGVALAPDAAQDSISVKGALLGGTSSRTETSAMITHSTDGNFALRQGQWKYIEGKPAYPWPGKLAMFEEGKSSQLYDLQNDIGETTNLLSQYPEKVRAMQAEIARQRDQGFSRPSALPYDRNDSPKIAPTAAVPAKPTAKLAAKPPPREQTFMQLDRDGSGTLSPDEFLPACPLKGDAGKERFRDLDRNGDGYLSKDEFINAGK
ncbi:MAG: sulfatase-like hydrolase/transferase [Kiritimatiellaceae bacterium]|nr:sulfatase-like hydrolase/transferase [Kiritimatiellaceae bacterium]